MIVYKVTNLINNKCYIGITINSLKRRKWQHLSLKYSGTAILSKAINKYGKENFLFEEIDTATSESELMEKERYWIAALNTLTPNGYNALDGSGSGRELAKSRFVPVICVEDGKLYKTISDAAKAYGVPKDSIWSVCNGRTDFAGNLSFRYADNNKFQKAERKRAKRKDKSSNNVKNGHVKTQKSIKCVNTGEIFKSVKEASIKLNLDPSQVVRVCKGKNKHVKGLVFIYL